MTALKNYLILTKPRVISLLIFMALVGYVLGARNDFSVLEFFGVFFGGAFASGGAASINMGLERDLDRQMGRTRGRPVASGVVSPKNAIAYGLGLNLAAFLVLFFVNNWVAAMFAMLGTLLYVVLYTIILKKSTSQNIVVGGAAGAIPPVVGYAAGVGAVEFFEPQHLISSLYLFSIIFFWTPPHFWALSLLIKKDYAKANVPMLPVVEGEKTTSTQILLYSVLLTALSITFTLINNALGLLYLVGAFLLGAVFIYLAFVNWRAGGTKTKAKPLYIYSLSYLFLLGVFVVVDGLIKPFS